METVTETVTEEVTETVTEEVTETVTEEVTETVTEEVTETVTEEILYSNHGLLKSQRNLILNETDKYLIVDFPITNENLIIIKEYRQALRDFTQNNYIMPDKPHFVITMN
jgi:hypothetical protein